MPAAVTLHWPATDIAQIVIDLPGRSTNTLSAACWDELTQLLAELSAKPDLAGVIIASGKPGQFLVGADLHEMATRLGRSQQQIQTDCAAHQQVLNKLHQLPVPSVALITGGCLGGGLELALACDFRWCTPQATLGFPEVKLGLIPGWGGSVWLPRLVGLPTAANMILEAETVAAETALTCGLVDRLQPEDALLNAAVAWLRESAGGEVAASREKRQRTLPMAPAEQEFLEFTLRQPVRHSLTRHHEAREAALAHLLRTSTMTAEDSLSDAAHIVSQLFGSPAHRGLLNSFLLVDRNKRLSRQQASTLSSEQQTPQATLGIVGAGIMGRGIAGAALRNGWEVVLCDTNAEALAASQPDILQQASFEKQTGQPSIAKQQQLAAHLQVSEQLSALASAQLVVEAIVETPAPKQELFAKLEAMLPETTILASNTSTIPISLLAKTLKRPEQFLGMHFFNPVSRMRLVEIVRGAQTSPLTITRAVDFAQRMGKMPIIVGDGAGFLVNRLLFPYLNEAIELLLEGASIEAVDAASVTFGMPLGPLALYDLVGLDTSVHAGMIMYRAFSDRAIASPLVPSLVKQGRLGHKSGEGFYLHTSSKGFTSPNPAAEKAITVYRKSERSFTQEELTDRLLLPMLLEATRALSEGIAASAEDVDLGMIYGLGFPSDRGGLLFWADQLGAATCLAKLEPYRHLGNRFQPTELLKQMAAEGKSFYSS